MTAGKDGARFLLLAGRPLNEPVVQYGPFVMNTRDEIEQAIRDYQNGRLVAETAARVSELSEVAAEVFRRYFQQCGL